jgi:hypothetical protein
LRSGVIDIVIFLVLGIDPLVRPGRYVVQRGRGKRFRAG